MQKVQVFIEQALASPEDFLQASSALSLQVKDALKCLYDSTQSDVVPLGPFEELLIENFDEEQIWQELHLRNEPLMQFLDLNLKEFSKAEDGGEVSLETCFENENCAENESCSENEESEKYSLSSEEENESYALSAEAESENAQSEDAKSQLDQEEVENESWDYGDCDEDEDNSGNEASLEQKQAKIKKELDFLMQPCENEFSEEEAENSVFSENIPKVDILDSDEEEEFTTQGTFKSSFEKEQEKLKTVISNLEEEIVKPKSWTMLGEATAKVRPVNSLLEENLEFEQNVKSAPVITEEVTESLEDRIKRRILDNIFDDVERKMIKEDLVRKELPELDQEKSKASLATLYEQEYQDKSSLKADDGHEEIKRLFKRLCVKLDALSNFHFTPKPAKEEIVIVTNVPSMNVEEVIPVHVSDASRLAPEEIYTPAKREIKGISERTSQDKRSLYLQKKKEIRSNNKEKTNPNQPITKEKAIKELSQNKNVKINEARKRIDIERAGFMKVAGMQDQFAKLNIHLKAAWLAQFEPHFPSIFKMYLASGISESSVPFLKEIICKEPDRLKPVAIVLQVNQVLFVQDSLYSQLSKLQTATASKKVVLPVEDDSSISNTASSGYYKLVLSDGQSSVIALCNTNLRLLVGCKLRILQWQLVLSVLVVDLFEVLGGGMIQNEREMLTQLLDAKTCA